LSPMPMVRASCLLVVRGAVIFGALGCQARP